MTEGEREVHEPARIEIPDVAVMVSTEIVRTLLDTWSEPVQIQIRREPGAPTGWELIARRAFPNTAAGEVAP